MNARMFWVQLALLVVAALLPLYAVHTLWLYYGVILAAAAYLTAFRYTIAALKVTLSGGIKAFNQLIDERDSLQKQLLEMKGTNECETCLKEASDGSEEVQG